MHVKLEHSGYQDESEKREEKIYKLPYEEKCTTILALLFFR